MSSIVAISCGCGSEGGAVVGPSADLRLTCLAPNAELAWPATATLDVPPAPEWKATLELPNDEFFSAPLSGGSAVRWVKFIVAASDPSQIFFHDAELEPFHYEFASRFIPAFQGMSRERFNAVSLQNEGREAILGTVLSPTRYPFPEYGVQLVSNDDLHPALVETILTTVAAHVHAPEPTRALYMPSGIAAACANGTALAARGVELASIDRWLPGNVCYQPGWAVGRLVTLPAAEVEAAYLDARLTADDILLLTDAAPAELPPVAGILTLEPSSPNSHVAILARTQGVPFAHVAKADVAALALSLAGKRVLVSTQAPFEGSDGCRLRFMDLDALPREQFEEIRSLALAPPLRINARRTSGVLALAADGLLPSDIDRVGGKAAHFGLLRAAVPDASPSPALAMTFDVWDAFLDAPVAGGGPSLRQLVAEQLAAHPWPPDMRALDTTLQYIRGTVEATPFPAPLRASVLEALAGFAPERRLRFRSSTNMEDSATFTGAGLYDSATGCLADDLDADDAGPSRCNAAQLEERGVIRALQRVYSSFYFRNAYYERLRRGVNEAEVGMGVLVHHSVPDTEELANGVATLSANGARRLASLVTQTGATSVTNPSGSERPEEVQIATYASDAPTVQTSSGSSLLPFGAHVLEHEAEYLELMRLFRAVSERHTQATGSVAPLLDFEYKKIAPGQLSLRQVRPLPPLDSTRDVVPFFVGTPIRLCVRSDERADVFETHRLKSQLALAGPGVRLTPEGLGTRLYTQANIEYLGGSGLQTLAGDPGGFAGAAHSVTNDGEVVTLLDEWSADGAVWALHTRLTPIAARNETPVLGSEDLYFQLSVHWPAPQPFIGPSSEDAPDWGPVARSEDTAFLWARCPDSVEVNADFPFVAHNFSFVSGITVDTSYWYPPVPLTSGNYTAPVARWEQTTIHGLSTLPIVLNGYYSQTYAPQHHNAGGQYIFDPRLEPGLPESTRAELQTANVAYLVIVDRDSQGAEDELWALGFDGLLRRL